ncbi:hypothetical protein BGW38_008153 [Lunasporangiospora selenospora]|uniref:Galactosyl transferase GMA12/MNN10 family protein n=1 Tax=Lunasporangiospora selenospora TaxID=979761 RepID=A0A9P6FY11_9FUNG|nr:hypothetical protein BGW38_008153 [Lunasporangiospora selenospora]
MPLRRTYLIAVMIFVMVVFVSHRRTSILPLQDQDPYELGTPQTKKPPPPDTGSHRPNDAHHGNHPVPIVNNNNNNDFIKPNQGSNNGPVQGQGQQQRQPNTSGKYDMLIVIPSSWNQMQNRNWVRETVFGIKNNLEPCKKHDGRIIYKFYIHGRSSWLKTKLHSADYSMAQVRALSAEFMEYNDYMFTNTTVTDKHTIWGEALNWAVNSYVPGEKITVDKVLIFDSTTIVNLPKMEATIASLVTTRNGLLYTWGESMTQFAAMISYAVAEQILRDRMAIGEGHKNLNLIEGATIFYQNSKTVTVTNGQGLLWENDVEQVPILTQAVGQVYQHEDWVQITQRLTIAPTPACAVDTNRKHNIAVLTSSYIYVDMCMAESALPSAENKRAYAAKHGYDFVARSAEFAQEEFRGRRLVWGKLAAIQKVLPHYEWLLWMDMDAVVANPEQDVRDIIRKAEELNENRKGDEDEAESSEISLIVSRPKRDKMFNAGVMLIKNTEWTRRYLSEVQRRKLWYFKKPSYEQGALWDVMLEDQWASGVMLLDRDDHTMNTFPAFYEEGDFIVHFAPDGCPADPVLAALKKITDGESILGVGAPKPVTPNTKP